MRLPTTVTSQSGQLEAHTLAIPPCCPVSRNPRPGSTITISYRPHGTSLEVAALYAYIDQFDGGLKDESGTVIVRNMEEMIQRIAIDCAAATGVPVGVTANLLIAPKQAMYLLVRAKP